MGKGTELAATEIMGKMKSASYIHLAAGDAKTNFYDLDGSRTQCQLINQHALEVALNLTSEQALDDYKKSGVQLTFDQLDYEVNKGRAWLKTPLRIAENGSV